MKTIKAQCFIGFENADKRYIRKDIENNPTKFLKDTLTSKFNFGVDNITKNGNFKYMGFFYDLRSFLKRFIYKQYGTWHEIYAINKTNAKSLISGKIQEIIEVK